MSVTLDHRLVAADAGQVSDSEPGRPDPDVPERARRRSFTAKYKLEVLAAYDAAEPGEKGAILRREPFEIMTEARPHALGPMYGRVR